MVGFSDRELSITISAIDKASAIFTKVGNSAQLLMLRFKGLANQAADKNAFADLQKHLGMTDKQITALANTSNLTKLNNAFDTYSASVNKASVATDKLNKHNKAMDNFLNGFPAQLLSIGFLFGAIAATGTAFIKQALDIFGSLGGTLTAGRLAFLELQAAIKMLLLEFAESKAMKEFLGIITGLVEKFNDLNPELKNMFFGVVLIATAISAIISPLAFFGLGMLGLKQFLTLFTAGGLLAKAAAGIGVLATAAWAAAMAFLSWAANMLIAIAPLAIMVALVLALGLIVATLGGTGVQASAKLTQAFKGVAQILDGIATGNIPKIAQGFGNLASGVIGFFLSVGVGVMKIITQLVVFFASAFTTLKELVYTFAIDHFYAPIAKAINLLAPLINFIIDGINAAKAFLGDTDTIAHVKVLTNAEIEANKLALIGTVADTTSEQLAKLALMEQNALTAWDSFLNTGLNAWDKFFTGITGQPIGIFEGATQDLTNSTTELNNAMLNNQTAVNDLTAAYQNAAANGVGGGMGDINTFTITNNFYGSANGDDAIWGFNNYDEFRTQLFSDFSDFWNQSTGAGT